MTVGEMIINGNLEMNCNLFMTISYQKSLYILLSITCTTACQFWHCNVNCYIQFLFQMMNANESHVWRNYQILQSMYPKLPNSEQSFKGKVKTHKYINRQNQSTTGKLWKHQNKKNVKDYIGSIKVLSDVHTIRYVLRWRWIINTGEL